MSGFASVAPSLAGALAILLLVLHLRARFERPYIRDWQYVWFMSAVGLFATALVGTNSGRLLSSLAWFAAVGAGALAAFWWISASRDVARYPMLSTCTYRRALVAAALIAIAAFAWIVQAPLSALTLRAVHASSLLLLTIVALSGAIVVLRRTTRDDLGRFIFVAASIAFAASRVVLLFREPQVITELLLHGLFGLALLVVILDDEHASAARAIDQVEHLAYHDALTALPNRALLLDRLTMATAHAARQRHRLAVLFLDLDRFKTINDSLGHSTGDALLRVAAERLRSCVRVEDTIARFGGDEFMILMPHIAKSEDAARVAQKVIATLSEPVVIAGREIVTTASVGIALFPNDGGDAETLIKNADAAMYAAKEEGRQSYRFFTEAINARTVEMLEIETALRRAVQHGEFVLHYQPLIDVASGSIFGLEALVRWNHPRLGLLSPDRFITVAESTGVIVSIGEWVLGEACRQARSWQRTLGHELVVSVNLSARQLQCADLVEQVKSALATTGLRARCLELEITETAAMHDVERTKRLLAELKGLGVRLSIDDFGTGYSSLSYLKQLPVDTLKLDQSFVREITVPEDGAIAKGVIAMAHSLELKVVAEGVETLGQLDFLRSHACDRLQGYLFSRPLEPKVFEKYLHTNGRVIRVA